MSSNNYRYYGITTARLALAVSTVTGVTAGPGVMNMMLHGFTGAAVYMSGVSVAVASMASGGAFIPTGAPPIHIGVSPVHISGTGAAAAEVSLTKFLSDPGAQGGSLYAY